MQKTPNVRGAYRPYDPNALTNAYLAVRNNGMSIRKASQSFDVPYATLQDRTRGNVSVDVVKSGTQPLFSLEDEAILANHLKSMAEVGYGYSRQDTMNLASDYAVHLNLRTSSQKPLTDRWLYSFLSRWPELKLKKPRALEVARAKSATRQAVDNYFVELGSILDKYGLKDKPHLIYNIDEKGLSTDHKPPKVVAGTFSQTQAITSGRSKLTTLIGAVNAVGQQVPPYFVFPGVRMMGSLLDGASPGADGTVSATGWSNSEIFSAFMKDHLIKFLPSRDPDNPVLVLYDGHKSHVPISLIEWAKSEHIILFVLPPYCSHLLQPLDVSCFWPLEVAWNSACHRYLRDSGGCIVTRHEVCRIACQMYAATISAQNITSSFRKCGIYPYDPTVVPNSMVAPSTTFVTRDNSCQEPGVSSSSAFLKEKENNIFKNKDTVHCAVGSV